MANPDNNNVNRRAAISVNPREANLALSIVLLLIFLNGSMIMARHLAACVSHQVFQGKLLDVSSIRVASGCGAAGRGLCSPIFHHIHGIMLFSQSLPRNPSQSRISFRTSNPHIGLDHRAILVIDSSVEPENRLRESQCLQKWNSSSKQVSQQEDKHQSLRS